MAVKPLLLCVIVTSCVLLVAGENSCCSPLLENHLAFKKECSKDGGTEEEIHQCMEARYRNEKGEEDYELAKAYMDSIDCQEDDRKILLDDWHGCLNDFSMKCDKSFLEICPNFCEVRDDRDEFDVCKQ